MKTLFPELNLTPHPRRELTEQIVAKAAELFTSVKQAPARSRSNFPTILKTNNFSISAFCSEKHIFLEISSKLKAMRDRQPKRLAVYRHFFTSVQLEPGKGIVLDDAQMIRMGKFTFESYGPLFLGADVSACLFDIENKYEIDGVMHSEKVDLLYVVSFGKKISTDNCWLELDSLIRVTLDEWKTSQ